MKLPYQRALATLLLLGGLPACNTDDPIPQAVPQADTFVAALKDGQPWREGGAAVFERSTGTWTVLGHQVPFTIHTPEALTLRFTHLRERPLTASTPLSAEWHALVGGDGVTDSYTTGADTLAIRITRLDTAQKIIEGTFTATLRRDAHWLKPGEPMRFMHFTQGSFRVPYEEKP